MSAFLAEHYKAVCVSSNGIREQLNALNLDPQSREKALKEYLLYLFERYDLPNKRIILDASIDRSYVIMFPYLKKRSIPFVVIRLEVPRAIVVERIIEQYGTQAENYLRYLDRWFQEYEHFATQYTNAIIVKNFSGCSFSDLTQKIDTHLT